MSSSASSQSFDYFDYRERSPSASTWDPDSRGDDKILPPGLEKSASFFLIGDLLPSGLPRKREYIEKEIQGIQSEIDDLEEMQLQRSFDQHIDSHINLAIEHLEQQKKLLSKELFSFHRVDCWDSIETIIGESAQVLQELVSNDS